jgi:hypothetical protein
MEIIATTQEVNTIVKKYPRSQYLLFPEDRDHPIKMTSNLPYRWIEQGVLEKFSGAADRGEFYSFQLGLFAVSKRIEDVKVAMSDLKNPDGRTIPASAFSSFNTQGIDWRGRGFQKRASVEKGTVQALWMGIQVPLDASPGWYIGEIAVASRDTKKQRIQLELNVTPAAAIEGGDNDPYKLTRLRWLNSQIAADDSIVAPFTPVVVNGSVVSCLGRDMTLSSAGLPLRITSHFSPEVTRLISEGRDVLSSPIELVIEDNNGKRIPWQGGNVTYAKKVSGVVSWASQSQAGKFDVSLKGALEFDGFADFQVTLTAQEETTVNDIRLEVPLAADVAKYMMGLGAKGGFCPKQFEWKWNQQHNQDAVWIGDVNAGVQVSFRDENYVRPLNTNGWVTNRSSTPRIQ